MTVSSPVPVVFCIFFAAGKADKSYHTLIDFISELSNAEIGLYIYGNDTKAAITAQAR